MTDDNDVPRTPPTIRNQTDLHREWRVVKGEWGWGNRKLWVMFIQPDDTGIMLLEVDDLPARPDGSEVRELMQGLVQLEAGLSFAFMYARPGRWARDEDDLAWIAAIHEAGREAGVNGWPLHFANDLSVSVVGPDDLACAI